MFSVIYVRPQNMVSLITHCLLATLMLSAASHSAANSSITSDNVRSAVREAGGVDAFLARLAQTIAESAPQRIDADWELIGVFRSRKNLSFTYRAYRYLRSDIHDVADTRSRALASTLSRLCTSPVSGTLILEYGVLYRYTLVSRQNEHIAQYEISASDCKSAGKRPPKGASRPNP